MGKANWNIFKATLDSNIKLKPLNNYSKEQIGLETTKWLNTVKQAMDTAIPKTTYKPIYQIRATPEIKKLERSYNALKNNSEMHGWTEHNYREYVRIRQELREKM